MKTVKGSVTLVDKADRDIGQGRLHGPFDSHAEMISFLHGQVEQSRRKNVAVE